MPTVDSTSNQGTKTTQISQGGPSVWRFVVSGGGFDSLCLVRKVKQFISDNSPFKLGECRVRGNRIALAGRTPAAQGSAWAPVGRWIENISFG